MKTLLSLLFLAILPACAPGTATDESLKTDTGAFADTGGDCPAGVTCVDTFPYRAAFDTTLSAQSDFDAYACAPSTDESGREFVFRVNIHTKSFVGVAIDDSAAGVDIDAHLLSDLDPETCLDRGNSDAGSVVEPGVYYVVADTYVSGGTEQAGAFDITIGVIPLSTGDCSLESGWLDRVGDDGNYLEMPAAGPMAIEAHLVTTQDGYGTSTIDPWPATITDNIEAHHRDSEDLTGFVMARDQPWAPQESCEFGQGACGSKLPPEDEAWYVNMYWADRPGGGTRMILQNDAGLAIVVAAGYETGPGNLDYIGGTVEEVHQYLGTGHGSPLTLGFAADETLPLGPIDCE
jgi:hypothetical protein